VFLEKNTKPAELQGKFFLESNVYQNLQAQIDQMFCESNYDQDLVYCEIKRNYDNHRLDFSISYISLYRALTADTKPDIEQLDHSEPTEDKDPIATSADSSKIAIRRERRFKTIEDFWTRLWKLEKMVGAKGDWKTIKESENTNIKYRESNGIITSLVDTTVPVSTFNFSMLLYELDLYSEFVPFCKEACEVFFLREKKLVAQDWSGRQSGLLEMECWQIFVVKGNLYDWFWLG
jgi:hypothetical protein